jgi:hypothetical protein
MVTDKLPEITASYIPSKGVKVGSKDEADGEGVPKIKVLRVMLLQLRRICQGNFSMGETDECSKYLVYQLTGDKNW